MKNLNKQDETTEALHHEDGYSSLIYPENQITVIDAYYKGVNGWTYSHTLLSDNQVSFDTSDTYEDLYLTRVLEDNPKPLHYLNDFHSEIEANIQADRVPIIDIEFAKSYMKGVK